MIKFNLVLLAALISSSLYLVKTAHEARTVFAAVERAKVEQVKLAAEHKRLEAERQQQATTVRVERTARERLRMQASNPAVSHYVVDPQGAVGQGKPNGEREVTSGPGQRGPMPTNGTVPAKAEAPAVALGAGVRP
jgi:cell division protein FtsL